MSRLLSSAIDLLSLHSRDPLYTHSGCITFRYNKKKAITSLYIPNSLGHMREIHREFAILHIISERIKRDRVGKYEWLLDAHQQVENAVSP